MKWWRLRVVPASNALCRFEGKPDWWSGFPVVLSEKLPRRGLDFGRFKDDAKLLHKAQGVPVDEAFYNLAASEPGGSYARDGKLFPRWRDSVRLTIMPFPRARVGSRHVLKANMR